VLIVTHKTARPNLEAALSALPGTGVLTGAPVALRIEEV
jgi:homoserine dehydrogenase